MKFLICICLLSIQNVHANEDDYSHVQYKTTPLGSSLFLLEGAGGNITASIGSDGTLLVDDDFAPMVNKLLLQLKQLKGAAPRFVFNTHFHYDHTGANEKLSNSAIIISATAVRNRLQHEQILWQTSHAPYPKEGLPTLTFDDSLTLHFNGDEVKAVHYPNGHTDGDTVIFFKKAAVIAMGDLYFSGMYPIFHPEHHGSIAGVVENITKILPQIPENAKIVPGHGPLSNKAELEFYQEMILESIDRVKAAIKKGLTLGQIQQAGLPKKYERFSHGYRSTSQWIESLYRGLNPDLTLRTQPR